MTPDSIFYSNDKTKRSTVTRSIVYTVECYEDEKIVNRVNYYQQQLAENKAEDFVLERK
jgi:hypothetical protein